MLILTRRVGETLMVGDDVTVTVLGVKGNQVRLGVDAPRDVSVHREEIYHRIQNEQGDELHAPRQLRDRSVRLKEAPETVACNRHARCECEADQDDHDGDSRDRLGDERREEPIGQVGRNPLAKPRLLRTRRRDPFDHAEDDGEYDEYSEIDDEYPEAGVPGGYVGDAETLLRRAIDIVKPGKRRGDIGHTIQSYAEKKLGYGVVRDFVGHGIGKHFHEEPQVPHVGKARTGVRLRPNMTFTIEPMINEGTYRLKVLEDDWTAVTLDGKLLKKRVLYHPHENEQPFTRSLSGVTIPAGVRQVKIRARDTVHGYSAQEFLVDLPLAE